MTSPTDLAPTDGTPVLYSRDIAANLRGLEEELAGDLAAAEAAAARVDEAPGVPIVLRLFLLQRWLGLGDLELVAEVEDRLSLRRFCGVGPDDSLPDADRLAGFRRRFARDPELSQGIAAVIRDGRRLLLRGPVPEISVVSPVYRAEETVVELVRQLTEALGLLTENFEIVLVEDGSPDRTWERIEGCCTADPRVRGIKLSRNFGQHAAITAGLAESRGDWVVVMDCDLQDDPRDIPRLYQHALDGAEVVFTEKQKREHGWLKNVFGHAFARVSNWLSRGDRADPRVGTYSMLSRQVVNAFLRFQDVHRHYLMLLRWLGFTSVRVPVRHRSRFAGRSSYSVLALVRHAVNGIVSHSDRLLYLSVALGFGFLTLFLLAVAGLVVAYFRTGFQAGWTSIVVLLLATTSVTLLSIGTAGIYVGKIFDQVKGRPLYVIEKSWNPTALRPRK